MTRETPLGFQPPAVGEEEIEAVAETLRSGWLTTGPRTALLEERMAEYLEAEHVLAVASGTAALHLALVALGVGQGVDGHRDEVITTPITWPATANVIVHAGATPVFVDVREGDLNIDPALVAEAVTERTRAILPVHLAGQPADLDPIWELELPVIEDAAHAVESAYRGRKLGGLSDATCFSLYATKNVAAGEGGLDQPQRRRGRDPGPAPDAARGRLALRPHRAGLQGQPLGRARGDRARPARQAAGAHRGARAAVRALRRGARRAGRDRAARA
jgi:dTDP-4-amino-4,6-dideoxygalactose transaminase